MRQLALGFAFVVSLVACQGKALPEDFSGTYVHTSSVGMDGKMAVAVDSPQAGIREAMKAGFGFSTTTELTVATSGASVRDESPLGMNAPRMNVGPLSVGVDSGGSDLFSTVSCNGKMCRFTTQNGCEGSFEHNAKGELVVIASKHCSAWSGTWTPKKS